MSEVLESRLPQASNVDFLGPTSNTQRSILTTFAGFIKTHPSIRSFVADCRFHSPANVGVAAASRPPGGIDAAKVGGSRENWARHLAQHDGCWAPARNPVALLPVGEAGNFRHFGTGKLSKKLRIRGQTPVCSASASFHTMSVKMPEVVPRSIPPLGSLKAVLFDVDGTLCDSDPLHYVAFRDMLQEVGYNGGVPITEEFFSKYISGKFNADIGRFLFPEWDLAAQTKFLDAKEAFFRRMAANQLEGHEGLLRFAEWLKKKNIRRAAVTNAPRLNAEQMIAGVGLGDFFEHLVIGLECTRAKPFPDPYLKGLSLLGVEADQAFVFEDSPAGIKAAVDAELAVVGVLAGNPRSSLLEAGASFVIESFDDPALWKALGEED